jgi:hypothetical protein
MFPDRPGDETAVFSPCRTWRYVLRRRWAPGPVVAFILLNPSTADESENDPTITRCIDFAKRWGFSGLVLGNIFALCSTDPDALYEAKDPIGHSPSGENDRWLDQIVREAEGCVVLGWGMHGTYMARGEAVAARLRAEHPGITLKAFLRTKGGQPGHPLYIPASMELQEWPA